MSLIEELKRRNVFRVGIAYVVVCWLVMQVLEIVLDSFGSPEWVMKTVLVVLAAGFPITLIIAWAFEMTPEGIKKEKDVDRSQSITHRTGRKLDFVIIGILLMALGYFAWDKFVPGQDQELIYSTDTQAVAAGADASESTEKSIAVLPFVNMSSDAEQEYFSDGISEEILNALAKVKELKVAGRTSSFAFKGKSQDIRQIGEALGVEHILEGSVRKSGTTVRITAQLIQVEDGFHLWSDTYDRELNDVFAIQDEIATAILEQLKAALIGFEPETAVAATARTNSEAYDLYLLARQRIYERKRLSIEAAVELLDKALTIDPQYAPAYAQRGIATLLLSRRNYGEDSVAEAAVEARLYLDKALELDPDQAEAWAGLGLLYTNTPGEDLKAIEPLERALEINPSLIDASNWLQVTYGDLGESKKALKILEDMVERDPLYPPGFGNAVIAYNFFGMQEKSWALLDRIRPFLPGDPQILLSEASTWLSLGKPARAQLMLESALETQPSNAVMKNALAVTLLQTAQYEKMLEIDMPWARSIALWQLDRREESKIVSEEMASRGHIGALVRDYYGTGQFQELIKFIESRWSDLAELEAQYPHSGDGFYLMLNVANAYSAVGNEAKFNDAMQRIRTAHDRALDQGAKDPFLSVAEARYYILLGNRDTAMEMVALSVDNGLMFGERFEEVWAEFDVLAGNPQYEEMHVTLLKRVNEQRGELGLEPLST